MGLEMADKTLAEVLRGLIVLVCILIGMVAILTGAVIVLIVKVNS